MRIYTSYFYMVRFFKPNMLPVSTAVWDPKWYHAFKDQKFRFRDKNGVWNGFRAEKLHPQEDNHNCPCENKEQENCLFKQKYKEQLSKVDAHKMLDSMEEFMIKLKAKEGWEGEPTIVFLVHEAPNNPCSERKAIQEWLINAGYKVKELEKTDI